MESKTQIIVVSALIVAVVISMVGVLVDFSGNSGEGEVNTFNSYQELVDYVNDSSSTNFYYGSEMVLEGAVAGSMDSSESSASAVPKAGGQANDYSTTNIQVQGVDEPDIVKNDGEYIYVVSGKKVIIVDAFPASNMRILSEIEFKDRVTNIFINDDELIVFRQGREELAVDSEEIGAKMIAENYYPRYRYESKTLIDVYGIADRENPVNKHYYSLDGSYQDARMIGDYVYTISRKRIYLDSVALPAFNVDGVIEASVVSDVIYFPDQDSNYVFSSVIAIDLKNGDFEKEVYLTGASHKLYVSENNIYLTLQKRISYNSYFEEMVEDVLMELLPNREKNQVREVLESDDRSYEKQREVGEIVEKYSRSLSGEERSEFDKELFEKLQEFEFEFSKKVERTLIHKISIDEDEISYEDSGEVPGRILNQFSMDEFDGNFRIATTSGNSWQDTSLNHVYVLDEDLEIIGSVEDLAQGERIYSARFMGDRAYMVTFKQVDPLFVIDLSDPHDPEVLGFLKVTGFSNYLHPYDENHIIGVGREASLEGRAEGVKIALFDVSDVNNPKEISKYEISEDYSNSNALHDHKSFLFDRERNLLVIPMSYNTKIGEEVTDRGYSYPIYEYWQGAFVFDINLDDGISLRGEITHKPNENEEGYYSGPYAVQRSLYMDNVLYTISRAFIKANELGDLDEINALELPVEEERYYGYAEPGILESSVGVVTVN